MIIRVGYSRLGVVIVGRKTELSAPSGQADPCSLPGDYIIVVFVFCSLVVVLVFVELLFFEFVYNHNN